MSGTGDPHLGALDEGDLAVPVDALGGLHGFPGERSRV